MDKEIRAPIPIVDRVSLLSKVCPREQGQLSFREYRRNPLRLVLRLPASLFSRRTGFASSAFGRGGSDTDARHRGGEPAADHGQARFGIGFVFVVFGAHLVIFVERHTTARGDHDAGERGDPARH